MLSVVYDLSWLSYATSSSLNMQPMFAQTNISAKLKDTKDSWNIKIFNVCLIHYSISFISTAGHCLSISACAASHSICISLCPPRRRSSNQFRKLAYGGETTLFQYPHGRHSFLEVYKECCTRLGILLTCSYAWELPMESSDSHVHRPYHSDNFTVRTALQSCDKLIYTKFICSFRIISNFFNPPPTFRSMRLAALNHVDSNTHSVTFMNRIYYISILAVVSLNVGQYKSKRIAV